MTIERHRKHRTLTLSLALATVAAFLVAPAFAESVDVDLRAGYNTDIEEALIGGGVLFGVGDSGRWFANPNVEIVLGDDIDQIALNGDFHYDFHIGSGASYWLGGGPALVHREVGPFDDTELGLNLLAGIGATRGNVRPYVQGRVTIKDDSEAAVVVGIRF